MYLTYPARSAINAVNKAFTQTLCVSRITFYDILATLAAEIKDADYNGKMNGDWYD